MGFDPLHAPTPALALTAGKFNAGYTHETVLCYQACVERELTPRNDKQANLAGVSYPSTFSLPTHVLWAVSSLQASEVMDDGSPRDNTTSWSLDLLTLCLRETVRSQQQDVVAWVTVNLH